MPWSAVAAACLLVLISAGSSAAQTDPRKAAAYIPAGKAAMAAGDLERAVQFFEKAIAEDPAHLEARKLFAAAAKARSESHAKSVALTAAGDAALAAGVYEKALGYYEKALEDWRENAEAAAGLTSALTRQRDETKKAALDLARLYADRGQWESARDSYLKALAADPSDADVRDAASRYVAMRPVPGERAWLKAWTEAINEAMPWTLLLGALVLVIVANAINKRRSRRAVEVSPFDGPDPTFKQGTGQGMAAVASSQLHEAGFALERGAVAEPLTALSAKLADANTKLLGEALAWLFPAAGFRLEAVVHQEVTPPPDVPARVGITAKLIRLGFWMPREAVVATTTFWSVGGGPVHETLARLVAAWAEWHVANG